jgi:hypothetical protein
MLVSNGTVMTDGMVNLSSSRQLVWCNHAPFVSLVNSSTYMGYCLPALKSIHARSAISPCNDAYGKMTVLCGTTTAAGLPRACAGAAGGGR